MSTNTETRYGDYFPSSEREALETKLREAQAREVAISDTLRRWTKGGARDIPPSLYQLPFVLMGALADWIDGQALLPSAGNAVLEELGKLREENERLETVEAHWKHYNAQIEGMAKQEIRELREQLQAATTAKDAAIARCGVLESALQRLQDVACGGCSDEEWLQEMKRVNDVLTAHPASVPTAEAREIQLVRLIHQPPPCVDRVVSHPDKFGRTFHFLDATTRSQGDYRVGDPVSPAPLGAVGAIQKEDGSWWWVVQPPTTEEARDK